MTDRFDELRRHDSQNQLQVLDSWLDNFFSARQSALQVKIIDFNPKKVKNIVVCGMGGSLIAGSITKDILQLSSPVNVDIVNSYDLPAYIDRHSFVIAISYSGNTEETLNALKTAVTREAQIVAITCGGQLAAFAQANEIPCFITQTGFQPRFALAILLGTVIGALELCNLYPTLLNPEELASELESFINQLKISVDESTNEAKKVAEAVYNTIPLIISDSTAIAHRIKANLNENAKMVAFADIYPELFHNTVSWWINSSSTPLSVIDFCVGVSPFQPRLQQKTAFLTQTAQSFNYQHSFFFPGDDLLVRLLKNLIFGDYFSYYVALLRAQDPSSIEMIQRLKTI